MSEPNFQDRRKRKANYFISLLMTAFVPRWVRVNTLKIAFVDFLKRLDVLSLSPVPDLASLKDNRNGYLVDINVANLLAFHSSYPVTTIFANEYASGTIILQDKASCIPADLLDVGFGSNVLDACAAPGNKTTQLAAAVGATGKVIAVEKDSKRVETLRNMVEKAGASSCTTQ
jgi:25S rRNA (cytosine2278-C5)-methyltransferase